MESLLLLTQTSSKEVEVDIFEGKHHVDIGPDVVCLLGITNKKNLRSMHEESSGWTQ